MTNANQTIRNTYDLDTFQEIADHGCASGVCSQHIYYADTKAFFGDHEDEITDYIIDNLGVDHLSNTLKQHNGSLDMYMNDMTWTFIELVAMQVIDEYEKTTLEEEQEIASYFVH